jgi:hypothetical protein
VENPTFSGFWWNSERFAKHFEVQSVTILLSMEVIISLEASKHFYRSALEDE